MIKLRVESISIQTPFPTKLKLSLTFSGQTHTTDFFQQSTMTQINHSFQFVNKHRTSHLECIIQVYQLVNKQERLCGTAYLNRDVLEVKGKQVRKIRDCPDKEAVVIFQVEGWENMEESTDCQVEDRDTSLKPIIEMLSNSLYKEERRKIPVGGMNHKEVDRFHGRYKRVIANLDQELKEVRESSQHKIKTLETDLKDTAKLHSKQLQKLKTQISQYKSKQYNISYKFCQTQQVFTQDSSVQARPVCFDQQSQILPGDFDPSPILLSQQNFQTEMPQIILIRQPSIPKSKVTIGCQMDQTQIQMQEQIQYLLTQLEEEKERCMGMAAEIQNLKEERHITQGKRKQEVEREMEGVKVRMSIQVFQEKGRYEKTIRELEERVKNYQKEMEMLQQDKMLDLEDHLAEEIEKMKNQLFSKQSNFKNVQKIDVQVDCQILQDEMNKMLQEVFEDNSRLAAKLEQATAKNYQQQQLIEQLEAELNTLSALTQQLQVNKGKLQEELSQLKHEHEAFVELNKKMYEQREIMLKTIQRFELQEKQLRGFARNIGKKIESKEDTILERSGQKERSFISRRSRAQNVNRRQSRQSTTNKVQSQIQPNQLPIPSTIKTNILQIPSLQLKKKSSYGSSDNAGAIDYIEMPSQSFRGDLMKESDILIESPPNQNENAEQQLLINSAVDSQSHQSADPTAQIKQSLLALHKECEDQREQIDNLNFELDIQQEKILNYESTIAALQTQKQQTRTTYEGIVEDLRKDLSFLNEEKEGLNGKCEELELQKEAIRAEFQKQMEKAIRQHCQKEDDMLREHAEMIEALKQQLDTIVRELQNKIDSLNDEKMILQRKVQELQQVIEHHRQQLDQKELELDQRNDEYLLELQNACRQVENIQQILFEREKQCADLTDKTDELELKVVEMESREKGYSQMLQQRDARIQQLLKTQRNSSNQSDSVQKQHAQTQTDHGQQVVRNRRNSQGNRQYRQYIQEGIRKRKVSEQISLQQFPLSIHQSQQISHILSDGIRQSIMRENPRNIHVRDDRIKEQEEKILELEHILKQMQAQNEQMVVQTHETMEYYEQQLNVLRQMIKMAENKLNSKEEQFQHCLQQKNHEFEQLKTNSTDKEERMKHEYENHIEDLTKEYSKKLKSLEENIVNGTAKNLKLQHQLASAKSSYDSIEQKYKKLDIQNRQTKFQLQNYKKVVESYESKYRVQITDREQKVNRLIQVIKQQFHKQLKFQKELMAVQNKIHFGTPIATHRLLHQDDTNTSQQAILREMGSEKRVQAQTQANQTVIFKSSDTNRYQELVKLKDQQLKSLIQQMKLMKVEQEATKKSNDERSKMYKKRITKLVEENFKLRTSADNMKAIYQKDEVQNEIIQQIMGSNLSK